MSLKSYSIVVKLVKPPAGPSLSIASSSSLSSGILNKHNQYAKLAEIFTKHMVETYKLSESTNPASTTPRAVVDKTFFAPNFVIPTITIQDYATRLFEFTAESRAAAWLAAVYIDRYMSADKNRIMDFLVVHRLILASYTLALKYVMDAPYLNSYMAKVGGVTVANLSMMERTFWRAINFDLSHPTDNCQNKPMMELFWKMFPI
jgi:hypothetical protein